MRFVVRREKTKERTKKRKGQTSVARMRAFVLSTRLKKLLCFCGDVERELLEDEKEGIGIDEDEDDEDDDDDDEEEEEEEEEETLGEEVGTAISMSSRLARDFSLRDLGSLTPGRVGER